MSKVLSIITVNWNNKSGINLTAESIKNLERRNEIEWIVIDGGSSDGSVEVLSDYNVDRIISEKDDGIYDAMNKGINFATGDYIVFMNSGDAFYRYDIIDLIKNKKFKNKILSFSAIFVSGSNKFLFRPKMDKLCDFSLQNPFCHQALFYKTASLKEIGGYNLNIKISSDFDLTLRYFIKNGGKCFNEITAICSLGGVSCNYKYKSLKDRMGSILNSKKYLLIFLSICTFFIYVFKIYLVDFLEKNGLIWHYRNFFKGVKSEK